MNGDEAFSAKESASAPPPAQGAPTDPEDAVAVRRAALEGDKPRNIVLFSDGTGNSSGKLQKTNVWRLYEALDLGYPTTASKSAPEPAVQLAYYDDGVGTSSFKPLYFLGGIFGLGLARNVRDIYMFLCRNYRAGDPRDKIYAFGFSRGAYTIRLVVALVALMGVVGYENEAQLRRQTLDLWREYRRTFHTNYRLTDLLVAIGRAIVRLAVRISRLVTRQPGYAHGLPGERPPWWGREWYEYWLDEEEKKKRKIKKADPLGPEIEFVGVWDTVAAYGGPVIEITRAIDAWIWPLTMPNYRLSTKVKCARHALAIDDKRESFHPLLWDEVHERDLPSWDPDEPRLQQVWFAGVHADVGGGYPDDFLSYVSLGWMIEHAEKAGLRLLDRYRDHIFEVRNVFGPIHDSRGGAGAFYRYQPRYINAWLDYDDPVKADSHVRPGTQIYRDPTIDRGHYRTRGFIRSPIRLHHSVEERLLTATDGYGPSNLPSEYLVDDGIRGLLPAMAKRPPPVDDLYELGDRIKLRRMWYFLSVVMALVIVAKPLWDPCWQAIAGITVDVRTDTQVLAVGLKAILPQALDGWINTFANDPYFSLVLFAVLGLTTARGLAQENRMVDVSRHLWRFRFGSNVVASKPRDAHVAAGGPMLWAARIWRSTVPWQDFLAWLKWKGAPLLLGFMFWLAIWYAALAALTQVALVWQEVRPGQCPGAMRELGSVPRIDAIGIKRTVDINSPCIDLGAALDQQSSYEVTIAMQGDVWRDGSNVASPDGWQEPATLPRMFAGSTKFFRRVTTAPLFAPIFETRILKRGSGGFWYGDGIFMMRPALRQVGAPCDLKAAPSAGARPDGSACLWKGTLLTGSFTNKAHEQRRLFFFLNDAVFPVDWTNCRSQGGDCRAGPRLFPLKGRYGNNGGKAAITVRLLQAKTDRKQPAKLRSR